MFPVFYSKWSVFFAKWGIWTDTKTPIEGLLGARHTGMTDKRVWEEEGIIDKMVGDCDIFGW